MALFIYPKYKIIIDPESKKSQGLRVSDVVRRQYFDSPNLIYSLMVVLEIGTDVIKEKESQYFIGALVEGDEPEQGQLLDFVRVTNLFDRDRGGALYLTASDSDAPYMDVIDGMATEHSLYLMENPQRITAGSSFRFPVTGSVMNPERVVISYKIRASKSISGVGLTFGYSDRSEIDGTDSVDITTEWQYKLSLITIEYPAKYERSLCLTPTLVGDDWCEIANLNIVKLSHIANFFEATKARVGKIKGIIDPVFGILEGYGAYFQNLYATKNVNIAGTLTAGDENGFSSTFYVGKIHKNIIVNSIACNFSGAIKINEPTPVGIGSAVRVNGTTVLMVQAALWRDEHIGKWYTFSVWIKAELGTVSIYQDEHYIKDIEIDVSGEWRRHKVSFIIGESDNDSMYIRLQSTQAEIMFTAPQMERGENVSQYQPTDEHLSYVEDYGAWFSKGGIGGTIQNPLLKLNDDGSISSQDDSFVINVDGTGHFASGRFKWTKDTITLQDVTIRWEDMDEDAQNNLKPKSVSLSGQDTFHYADTFDELCEPEQITLFATEFNFIPTARKWEYLDANEAWKPIDKQQSDFLTIPPDFHGWEGRNTLTLRYTASLLEKEYADAFTINKLFDGEDAYSVTVHSDNGNSFINGDISASLTATLYKGSEDITDTLPDNTFNWKRISQNSDTDTVWNKLHMGVGRRITISDEDVFRRAMFECEVSIN